MRGFYLGDPYGDNQSGPYLPVFIPTQPDPEAAFQASYDMPCGLMQAYLQTGKMVLGLNPSAMAEPHESLRGSPATHLLHEQHKVLCTLVPSQAGSPALPVPLPKRGLFLSFTGQSFSQDIKLHLGGDAENRQGQKTGFPFPLLNLHSPPRA